jgi:hypothetical protein
MPAAVGPGYSTAYLPDTYAVSQVDGRTDGHTASAGKHTHASTHTHTYTHTYSPHSLATPSSNPQLPRPVFGQ